MSTAAVAANSASQVTPPSGGKRLVKSKSGLKIVCQHDRESAPWDMAEPQWTPDKEVCSEKFNVVYLSSRFLKHFHRLDKLKRLRNSIILFR